MTSHRTNPLMDPGKRPVQRDLDAHAKWLNGMNWAKGMGVRYFVGSRVNSDGAPERYLDRMDIVEERH